MPVGNSVTVAVLGCVLFFRGVSASCVQVTRRTSRFDYVSCLAVSQSRFESIVSGTDGGAISVVYSSDNAYTLIYGSTFDACRCDGLGGGIYIDCQRFSIGFCSGISCQSTGGGGFAALFGSMALTQHMVRELLIRSCSSTTSNGGVYVRHHQQFGARSFNVSQCETFHGAGLSWYGVALTNSYPGFAIFSIFEDNDARECIYPFAMQVLTLQSCVFINNAVTQSVISVARSFAIVLDCIFQGNVVDPFYRGQDSSDVFFMVYDCVFDTSEQVSESLFNGTDSNSWAYEITISRFELRVMRPWAVGAPASTSFYTRNTESLRLGRPSYGTWPWIFGLPAQTPTPSPTPAPTVERPPEEPRIVAKGPTKSEIVAAAIGGAVVVILWGAAACCTAYPGAREKPARVRNDPEKSGASESNANADAGGTGPSRPPV
jgi:hypothetical protein